MLELWVTKAMANGVHITGEILRQKWMQFVDLFGVPKDNRLNLSKGWLTSFEKHCRLREFKKHGEAGSASIEDVENERTCMRDLIMKSGYRLKDIFNMDKTGFFYA
jgi:hypothetical protein